MAQTTPTRIKVAQATTNRFINIRLRGRFSGSRACPSFGTTDTCRQEMQRCELFHAGRMNIAKDQHVFKAILTPTLVSAASCESVGIFECSKEQVPKWNVSEVVGVMAELMMDAMRFGPLENEAEPRGSFNVPMIEEFPDCDENRAVSRSADAGAK
jgi:hypothetical protein